MESHFGPSRCFPTTSSTSVRSPGCGRHENLFFTSMVRSRRWQKVLETARSPWRWQIGRIRRTPSRAAAVSALATVADAAGYACPCHDAAERIFRAMSGDEVVRPVDSPLGTYPAWQYLVFAYDEHWHH